MAATGSTRQEKFAFGIWCLMNTGADPFGQAVRKAMTPQAAVRGLAERGFWGFEFHDADLFGDTPTPARRKKVIGEVKRIMDGTGIRCASGTTNLFSHPVFKDGAFTSHDPKVRAYAVAKAMRSMDVAAELGAENFIFWGGREGTEVDLAKSPLDALKRYREALCFLVEYALDNGYGFTVTVEPKPNEPRGDIFLPAVGNVLAFIETLPKRLGRRVGVNPEYAHIKMAGLNVVHEFGQALEAGKLFELHLNGQNPLRYDQDLAFGSDNPKEALLLVRLMERNRFAGIIAFDAHAYRVEDADGVWDFVERNLANYRILQEKAAAVDADPEIRHLLGEIDSGEPSPHAKYSARTASKLKSARWDPDRLAAARRLPYERLDQLLNEVLMGLR